MSKDNEVFQLKQLIKDARWSIAAFAFINTLVLVVLIVDGFMNQFVFLALFLQFLLFTVWLLPVFCYQLFIKKRSAKFALYKSLAAYKDALGHLS